MGKERIISNKNKETTNKQKQTVAKPHMTEKNKTTTDEEDDDDVWIILGACVCVDQNLSHHRE